MKSLVVILIFVSSVLGMIGAIDLPSWFNHLSFLIIATIVAFDMGKASQRVKAAKQSAERR